LAGTILVTGGAGYIGSHVCKALAGAGYEPVVYDNMQAGHLWAVQWGRLVEGDLLDPVRLRWALKHHQVEGVIHCAGLTSVPESVLQPTDYYQTNVGGTLCLLESMREVGVKALVFSSTCATYGAPNKLPIPETHQQVPTSPYGRSKLMAEQALGDFRQAYGIGSVALRYFNAAGADPRSDIGEERSVQTHLFPLALQAAFTGTEMTVHGTDYSTRDGTCVRDYVHVSDLAKAHLAALERLRAGKAAHAYNLGCGQGATVLEVLASIARVTGKRVPRTMGPRRQGDPPELVADATRARQELGWVPDFPQLDAMVRTAWSWELKRQMDPLPPVLPPPPGGA
jgi:UDP-arabinose 4-epimerase